MRRTAYEGLNSIDILLRIDCFDRRKHLLITSECGGGGWWPSYSSWPWAIADLKSATSAAADDDRLKARESVADDGSTHARLLTQTKNLSHSYTHSIAPTARRRMTWGRRMRTRRYAWDLELEADGHDEGLLDGLPRPSRQRRRLTTPATTTNTPSPSGGAEDEDGSSGSSNRSVAESGGHTTDDASVDSASSPSNAGSACASPIPPPEQQQQQAPAAASASASSSSSLALALVPETNGGRRRQQRGKVALVLGMIRMSHTFMEGYVGAFCL